jgi:hypothetical protein
MFSSVFEKRSKTHGIYILGCVGVSPMATVEFTIKGDCGDADRRRVYAYAGSLVQRVFSKGLARVFHYSKADISIN